MVLQLLPWYVTHAYKQARPTRVSFTYTTCTRYLRAQTFRWCAPYLHMGTAASLRLRANLARGGVLCWDWEA